MKTMRLTQKLSSWGGEQEIEHSQEQPANKGKIKLLYNLMAFFSINTMVTSGKPYLF